MKSPTVAAWRQQKSVRPCSKACSEPSDGPPGAWRRLSELYRHAAPAERRSLEGVGLWVAGCTDPAASLRALIEGVDLSHLERGECRPSQTRWRRACQAVDGAKDGSSKWRLLALSTLLWLGALLA